MKPCCWAFPMILAVVGCGQSVSPAASPTVPAVPADVQTGPFPAPDFSRASDLGLFPDNGNPPIKVGDNEQTFKADFQRSVKDTISVCELPIGANADQW